LSSGNLPEAVHQFLHFTGEGVFIFVCHAAGGNFYPAFLVLPIRIQNFLCDRKKAIMMPATSMSEPVQTNQTPDLYLPATPYN